MTSTRHSELVLPSREVEGVEVAEEKEVFVSKAQIEKDAENVSDYRIYYNGC